MAYLDYPTQFVDSADGHDVYLNGADLNLLRRNCIKLDGLSYRRQNVFDSLAGPDTASIDLHTRGKYYVYRGAFQFGTGMTTLTLQGYAANNGSNTIDVYLYQADKIHEDGSHPSDATHFTISIGTNWSGSFALGALGLTNGDLYYVDVQWDPSDYFDTMSLIDAYVSPVPSVGTWPGVPAFTTKYPAAKLNQILQAQQWIFDRINALPINPLMAQLYRQATHKHPGINLWSGSVRKHYAADALRLEFTVTCFCPEEKVQLYLNGALAWESAQFDENKTVDVAALIDLSAYSTSSVIKAVLYADVDEGHTYGPHEVTLNSRYTIRIMRTEALTAYPFATPPIEFPRNATLDQVTLTARLNALCTMLQNTYNRINGDPFTWNRIRLFTRPYAQDATQASRVKKRYRPRYERRGARLLVRGKALQISYGALTLETSDEDGDDHEFKYNIARTQTIVDGDKVGWQTVYLDTVPALYNDETYYITGEDPQYVAAFLE